VVLWRDVPVWHDPALATTTRQSRPTPSDADIEALEEIERRALWLAVRIVDYANRERPSADPLKVGGHQASSASMVSLMTALWAWDLDADDRVSVKPHASPVLHALEYLLGRLDRRYLTTLRDFGGLQAYPSRTKDPFPVDYSTGSVGLGAAAPLFGALTARYVASHFDRPATGRFISLLGDAELDEGNVWEAILDPATRGLGEAVWIVDLNRQSLDRVVPGIRAAGLEAAFESAGWRVIELKYGRRLREAYARDGGDLLRRRIDEMPNPEYQSLFGAPDEEILERLGAPLSPGDRARLGQALEPDQGSLQTLVGSLGGHDLGDLTEALARTRQPAGCPTVIFAYTVKGYGLPIAGNPLNHSAHLTAEQIDEVRRALGADPRDEWAALPSDSPGGRLCAQARERLGPGRREPRRAELPVAESSPSPPAGRSTQEAFGRVLLQLAREEGVGERVVTVAPDVSVSTNLGGWINRVGVYGLDLEPSYGGEQALRWHVGPEGQHIELGISEMNLFLLLGQLGMAADLAGEQLLPVGTVYDPFVCRGLDALIYSLYSGARFVVAGTPSGISLSREGGAHQSTVTPSLGMELPGITYAEPAFAMEVDWLLRDGLRRLSAPDGESLYLRLSTKPIDQAPFQAALDAAGPQRLRAGVVAGGYVLHRPAGGPDQVAIAVCGALLPEALAAAEQLAEEDGIDAWVLNLTSPDRLYRGWRHARLAPIADARQRPAPSHLERLLGELPAGTPIVSVIDGASHSLSFLGSAAGVPQVALGVDAFGQSGGLAEVYDAYDVSAGAIASAAVAALWNNGV
jgi:pyruvate dehydrogenase E1 component